MHRTVEPWHIDRAVLTSVVEELLDHLGQPKAGAAIFAAVAKVLKDRKVQTPDLGGKATTSEIGDAVLAALANTP